MKIKQIMLKNFASVNQIEINLSDSVTYLIGENGSGKTTVGLNAIWFILEGLSLKGKKVLHGDRFRFIGNHGKSAVGQIILHDETEGIDITISRKLLKNKTELKITASDKRQLPADFINDIFNIFSINPMGFAKLTPQEQAEAFGIDTSKYDELKKVTYDERKELGRDVKRLEGAVEEFGVVDKIEPVDFQMLLQNKDKIEKANAELVEIAQAEKDHKVQEAVEYNKVQTKKQAAIIDVTRQIKQTEEFVKTLQNNLEELKLKIKNNIKIHKQLVKQCSELPIPDKQKSIDIPFIRPSHFMDTSVLNQQIETAEATNQKATLYQQSLDAEKKHATACEKHTAKQDEMDKIEVDRIEYLKSCNLPFANITIDDTGGVLINNRPFSETYFSKGEILRMGIKLAAAANPKLKYVFIPDSQSIDENNREKLFDELTEAGFQVVAEYVDTEKRKDHGSILLREGKVIESYDNNEDDLNML